MLDESDHRHIGQRLDLFHQQEEAPGMVFWHPRGFTLYRLLEASLRRQMDRQGFREVRTPQVLRQEIWESSGHWQNFADDMFVLSHDEGMRSALKPVSCPGHLQIVARMAPSYRDLPLRICELGLCHRNEQSGALHGLFRLRQFTQDDGHILCSLDQIGAEVAAFVESLRSFYGAFGFREVSVGFSTRPAVRAGSDEVWDEAEAALREAAEGAGLAYEVQPGQGAFYGPKLEFVLRDRVGRSWQCGTIQLDLVLPERFGVHYTESSGARRRPAMLHRALVGSLERFLGVLLEQHRGALPAWLSPEQIVVTPVNAGEGAQAGHAEHAAIALRAAGLRVEVDARSETLARKIADAHTRAVPFVAVVGAREAARGSVSVRDRDGASRELPLAEAAASIAAMCEPPL
jgi:threonyl-tRNA synthetase